MDSSQRLLDYLAQPPPLARACQIIQSPAVFAVVQ